MGIFSKINPMKVLGGVAKFTDESFLSREEVQKAIAQHAKDTLNESTPRSLTRRYIAVCIIASWLLFLIMAASLYWFSQDYAAFVLGIAKEMWSIIVTIVIFYFGGYYGDKLLKTRKQLKEEAKAKND
jgi:hypothetical protein